MGLSREQPTRGDSFGIGVILANYQIKGTCCWSRDEFTTFANIAAKYEA